MNVDDIVKLLLALSVSGSLLFISIQIGLLIGSVVGIIRDVRKISSMAVEDYSAVRQAVYSFTSVFVDFRTAVLGPMAAMIRLVGRFRGRGNRRQSEDTDAVEATPTETTPEEA